MTQFIIILACVAAVLFCAFLAIRAWNRPKVEAAINERQKTRAERWKNWVRPRLSKRVPLESIESDKNTIENADNKDSL